MADIRLYQNATLSSPVGADIIFTANSASTPQWIETKTTMAQLATYMQSNMSDITTNSLNIANVFTANVSSSALAQIYAGGILTKTYSPVLGIVTQSGNTITLTGGTFTSAMTYGIIEIQGFPPDFITAVLSSTQLTVTQSQSIALGTPFTIYYGGIAGIKTNSDNVGFSNTNIYGLPSSTQTLTDGSTVSMDYTLGGIGLLTLGGAHTINIPSHLSAGKIFVLSVTSQGYQPTWASGYSFPNGAPFSNPVLGSIDTYTFLATSLSTAVLTNYTSSVPNWSNWDGSNNIPAASFNVNLAANTGGISYSSIPNTNNVLVAVCQGTTNIKLFVATYDARGRLTFPTTANWTTITPTSLVAAKVSMCVLTDGLNAIVGYKATSGGTSCLQLTPISISGTTLTLGTTNQIRSTEVVVAGSSLKELDTSNFGVVFRTTTSNILYAYQCSVSAGVITVGSSGLTIETGNTATTDVAQAPIDSSHTMLEFRSTVTATAGYLYAGVLTFNGTGSAPTIGSTLQLTTSTPAAICSGLKVAQFLNNPGYFIFGWNDSTTAERTVMLQVIQNVSGTPTVTGTTFASDQMFNNNVMSFFQCDANHCIAIGNNSDPTASGFIVANIDSNYNMTTGVQSLPTGLSMLSPPSIAFIPINNNTMGLLGFTNGGGNQLISYQTIRP